MLEPEQREARLAKHGERYRAQRRQESQHTRQSMPIDQTNVLGGKQRLPKQGRNFWAAERLRREAETHEARPKLWSSFDGYFIVSSL